MRKFNNGIKSVMLLICCTIVSSLSWASTGAGMISAFVSSITGAVETAMYTACCNKTCNKWTKTCKQCNKYRACEYTDDAAPAVPVNLKATASITSVSLSWTAVTGATSYIVYSGTTASALTQYATTNSTSFSLNNLTPNTKYFYSVAAKNAAGTSAQCSAIQVTTLIASGIQTHYTSGELVNVKDLLVEAYLPNGEFAGACMASDISYSSNQVVANNMKLKAGIYQIVIKDQRSGRLIESKSVTILGK
jgi:hypothetical protein